MLAVAVAYAESNFDHNTSLEAIKLGSVSSDIVLNLLSRQGDEQVPGAIEPPVYLRLKEEPVADCTRYDSLLREVRYAAQ